MLTYSRIGHFGRLGNQLFQFAATYGIAKKLGYDVKFPIENTTDAVTEHFKDGKMLDITFDLPKVFELSSDLLDSRSNIKTEYSVQERQFHFDGELFKIPNSCDLSGYFQSDKYFSHVEEDLRNLLTFKSEIKEKAEKLFPKVTGSTISIHVRRGDYVNQPQFHPACSSDYYMKAAGKFINDEPNFIIFSDDVEYCRSLFVEDENILYLDNTDPYVDLALMSMCDHNIIANSSFSWWGAWLNKNKDKKVVAPRKWFGPAYSHYIVDDLFCKNWIIL